MKTWELRDRPHRLGGCQDVPPTADIWVPEERDILALRSLRRGLNLLDVWKAERTWPSG